MPNNGERQFHLLKAMLRPWAWIVGICALIILFTWMGQAAWIDNRKSDIRGAQQQQYFWAVVAGKPADPDSPLRKLALDLYTRLGATDPAAKILPEAITAFEVKKSEYSYHGVDAETEHTVNLFAGCGRHSELDDDECGKLAENTLKNLLLIKQGKSQEAINSIRMPNDPGGYNLTPFGLGFWKSILWGWLIIGTVVYFYVRLYFESEHDYQYRLINLRWQLDGDYDWAKVGNLVLAPGVLVPYLFGRQLMNIKLNRQLRRENPAAMAAADMTLRKIRSMARSNPGNPQIEPLRRKRQQLLDSLMGTGDVDTITRELDDLLMGRQLQQEVVHDLNEEFPVLNQK